VNRANPCLVAIAYIMQKVPYVFPIVGGRKVEQLLSNVEALDIILTPEHIKYLESIVPFNPGFPYSFIVRIAGFSNYTVNADSATRKGIRTRAIVFVGK
jgi:hypothetical protein